jgi:hypothetical protein
MTVEKKPTPFYVVRHRGTPSKAQLPDGVWIERQDKIWIPEWGGFVMCAPYSDHFLYQLPEKYLGSALMCTCGSIAVVTGLSGYVLDASPQGKLLVCKFHADKGIHATGGSTWV